jgi:agmatine deiminase
MASGGEGAESIELLVPDAAQELVARQELSLPGARFHRVPYGDVWLRDTGPVFLGHREGKRACARFAFNGWGNKYRYAGDESVARRMADRSGLLQFVFPFVFEGGAVEVDGEGTCLAAGDCLLNPNRNPGTGPQQMEAALREALGAERVLWLRGKLLNDHTDGHLDTLARFVAPGAVVCMEPRDPDDPNAGALQQVALQLRGLRDAAGRALRVFPIPSPGRVEDDRGRIMPASFLNFFIGNRTVAVPIYGSEFDDEAVQAIARFFPGRRTVGLRADSILHGGGAFHCLTLAEPLGEEP